MNPFARYIDGGRRYLCPVCQCSNEGEWVRSALCGQLLINAHMQTVPPEYFCHLDHQGQRTDAMQRPELCYGSVEYLATKDYCKVRNSYQSYDSHVTIKIDLPMMSLLGRENATPSRVHLYD